MKPYLLFCRFHELLKSAVSRAQGCVIFQSRCWPLSSPPSLSAILKGLFSGYPRQNQFSVPPCSQRGMEATWELPVWFTAYSNTENSAWQNRRHSVSFCSYFLHPTSIGQTLSYSPYRHSNPSNIPRIYLHFTEDKQTYRMLCRTMNLNWWGKKKL